MTLRYIIGAGVAAAAMAGGACAVPPRSAARARSATR